MLDITERKQKIIEMLEETGKVKVKELCELFDVSDVRIRRDLEALESEGLLSRIHGGAVSSYKTYYNMSFNQRMDTNQKQKKQIAEKAASMIEDSDTVMLNSGTTTLLTFRMLPANMSLSIVTNSVLIALEAASNPNFNVMLLGGSINSKYQFTYGDDAYSQLERYHADKLILSVDGISSDGTASTYYSKEAELARRMLRQSNISIFAADYTKIGRVAFSEIAPLTADDMIITNANAPEDELESLRQLVSDVILV